MPVTAAAVGLSLLPNFGGWLGSLSTRNAIKDWYPLLKKAPWTPPNYVFGPMWTTLYTGMGYASYLVWKDGGGLEGAARWPLTVYAAQLALNWAWTPMFFSYRSVKWALVDITLLTATVGYCGSLFYEINQTAGKLFLPYMAWLCIATSLNTYIYLNNPVIPEPLPEKKEK